MDKRLKDITTMAEQAGLSPLRSERRSNRVLLHCLAENGAVRAFSVTTGSRGDHRGDLNELGAMKRFARENKLPDTEPAKKKTLTMAKPDTNRPSLSPVEFYRMCEWVKVQNLANFPTLEALTLEAAKHICTSVPEDEVKLAMSTTSTQEPVHWSEPTDPQAILVRELARMMKQLGEKPSPAFERLHAAMLPGHTL